MKIEIDPKAKLVGKKNLCALKIFGFWKSQGSALQRKNLMSLSIQKLHIIIFFVC